VRLQDKRCRDYRAPDCYARSQKS